MLRLSKGEWQGAHASRASGWRQGDTGKAYFRGTTNEKRKKGCSSAFWPGESILIASHRSTTNKKYLLIPKEHGAWGILLVPFFIGLSVAGGWNTETLLLLGAVLALYLARYPLVLWARSGFAAHPEGLPTFLLFSSLGLLQGALLIFRYGLWLLAALGAMGIVFLLVHLWLVSRRKERTEIGEIAGICALTLTAPAAFYVSGGAMNEIAAVLWLLCVLYFGTSVFYVKMKVAGRSPGVVPSMDSGRRLSLSNAATPTSPTNPKLAWPLVLYLAIALASVAALSYFRLAPVLTFLAFAPLAVQAIIGVFKRDRRLDIKRLGYTLVAHSIGYGLILVAVFRLSFDPPP